MKVLTVRDFAITELFLFHTPAEADQQQVVETARERWTQRKSRAGPLDAYLSAVRNATHTT
jgi:hypothetical protein